MGELGSVDDSRTDEALLVRARTDPEAFAVFYRRHMEMVIGYFYRRTGCAQTAADLTAETFAQALASLHRYRPTGAPASSWLVGIARNQLRYYIRRRRVGARARSRLGMRTTVDVNQVAIERIEERFDTALLSDELQAAWESLSPKIADAVRMRVVDQLSYAAIAVALKCTEGAARVRVARGLSQLADTMGAR